MSFGTQQQFAMRSRYHCVLRIHKHAISWRSPMANHLSAEGLISFSCTCRSSDSPLFFCDRALHISYAYYVGRAKWKASRSVVGRYPPRITQALVHNYVDYISGWFLQPHRKFQAYMPDSVSFVCTNKVRVKEKNFLLQCKKKRNNINWCSMLSLLIITMTGYRSMISDDINGDDQAIYCNHRWQGIH